MAHDFFGAILLGVKVKQVTTYINLASLTLLGCDWIMNFIPEILLVWKSRWSSVKFLYLITRYMPFVDVSILVYQQVAPALTVKQCDSAYTTFGWMFTIGITSGEILLGLRTWAVWSHNLIIGIGLLCFYIGISIAQFVNMHFFLNAIVFHPSFPGITGCVVIDASNRLYITWILLMVLDIGVCTLMIIKGLKTYVSGGNTQLTKVVYRDGIVYYIYLVILSMANVILIFRLQHEYLALLAAPMRAIHSVLTCRIILHTREQGRKEVVLGEKDGFQIPGRGGGQSGSGGDSENIGTLRFASSRVDSALEDHES